MRPEGLKTAKQDKRTYRGQFSVNVEASFFAAPIDGVNLRRSHVLQTRVAELVKVWVGNFVAGFLVPCSPALVVEAMGGLKIEVNGSTNALPLGPSNFHALTATDLTVRQLTKGRLN